MENNPFQTRKPSILGNPRLRTPQRDAYTELAEFAGNPDEPDREVGIVLNRLKIIASALNYEHCRQIVEAYNARGRHADYAELDQIKQDFVGIAERAVQEVFDA